jgi:hypothetical protein
MGKYEEGTSQIIEPAMLIAKILMGISLFSIIIITFGLGAFLQYNDYHPLSFILVYLVLLTWPFLWVLPHTNLKQFDFFNGFLIGIVTVFLLGLYHITHLLIGGSDDAFLLIVPFAAFMETIGVGSFLVKKS